MDSQFYSTYRTLLGNRSLGSIMLLAAHFKGQGDGKKSDLCHFCLSLQ